MNPYSILPSYYSCAVGSNDLSLHVVEPFCNNSYQKIEINPYTDSLRFISATSNRSATWLQICYGDNRTRPNSCSYRWQAMYIQNPGPVLKYPCPVCTCNVTSRSVSNKWKRCSGGEMIRTLKCSTVSEKNLLDLKPRLLLPNKSMMTVCSTFYSSTLMELGTSWRNYE